MEKQENLSQSKYAEHRNVTKNYIGGLIKEGRLHLIKGKLNVAMSDAELDNKSNNDKAPNYWSEKALHEKAKRELAELDLKLKQDQLVEVDQVGDHLDKIFSAVRQRLLATPSKIPPFRPHLVSIIVRNISQQKYVCLYDISLEVNPP